MGKVRFIGAILPVKPEQCPEPAKTREAFGIAPGQKLVFAGISGPRAERIPLLRILEPIFEGFPDDVRVLMSTGDPSGSSDPISSGSLIKVPWLEDRFAVLHACDAVVSRGGHETIMQSICYRKPALVIPVPGHPEQYGNARAAERLGVADAIHQADLSPGYVLEHIRRLLGSPSYARSLSEMSSRANLGDGVDECLRALESVITQ
jgi:UDP:flavonoid glycosyltransferase YjiC (YdhE family)